MNQGKRVMNQRNRKGGLSRRHFLASAAVATTALSAPTVLAQGRPRVVVVGGGAGGATAARYIAKDSKGAVDVTLVEPSRAYYSCFFSNLYLGGFRDFASIGHSYGALAASHGINVVHDWAVSIDRDTRRVGLAGGSSLAYDRLVLSPGIDFRPGSVPGWDLSQQNRMPHAYKAGSQTQLLKAQIEAMPQGGVYCMIAPPNPFRCPPGPYERISMVAHVLKQANPTAKILIVDPKEKFSKQGLFEDGWQRHYPGMIERIGPDFGGDRVEVRPDTMEVVVDGEAMKVDVCNVIPAQQAGRIAARRGQSPTRPAGCRSSRTPCRAGRTRISMCSATPRSRVICPNRASRPTVKRRSAPWRCAGRSPAQRCFPRGFPTLAGRLSVPMTASRSVLPTKATDEKIAKTDGFISQTGESVEVRKATYEESLGWYAAISGDMFG